MNEERRYGINWVDLIIKIILLILFVLLICWLFPMPKLDTFYDKVFNENIQTMKTAARDYFTTERLPDSIGETKSMTLKQLIDNKLVLDFTDKDGKTCDTTNSYVQVTKTLDNEYALKVQLTCGDDSDYIIDTIGCNGTCLLSEINNNNNNNTSQTANDEKSNNSGSSLSNTGYTRYLPLSVNSSSSNSNSYNNNAKSSKTTTTTTTTTTTVIKKSTSSTNNNSKGSTIYYQQAKIVNDYGNWIQGNKTGNNIERKSESVKYYTYSRSSASASSEYRTTTYIDVNEGYRGYSYSYELQLTDIPSSATNLKYSSSRYFNTSDYQAYINNRNSNLYMSGNSMLYNSAINNATTFRNTSLKNSNFNYSFSNPYKSNGVWRIKVYITIKDIYGVSSNYDYTLGKNIYYVPVYFRITYNSNNNSGTITDTLENSYKYPGYTRTYAYTRTVNYYRYVNQYVDHNQTIWSTSRYLSGYQFTGNTKRA